MEEGVFHTYWYEKNLQGDVIGVYNESGARLISYDYDAWGRMNKGVGNAYGVDACVLNNPFTYRGYYYDAETGFYYLESRYYDPNTGRFINADGQLNNGLLGKNMYAYCGNNPIMYVDSTGRDIDWGTVLDVAINLVAISAGMTAGIVTMPFVTPVGGLVVMWFTTGLINNTVNAIYYEFSDGISILEMNKEKSDYVDRIYINRWERLDYVKQQTREQHYFSDAWRFYAEYSAHMYAWFIVSNVIGAENYNEVSIARRARKANVYPNTWDMSPEVLLATGAFMLLGI